MYVVTLKSPCGRQSRVVKLAADDEPTARERALMLEDKRVGYSIQDDPGLSAGDHDRIMACYVDNEGKVLGGSARDRVRFHAHHQEKPYTIESVEKK